MVGATSSEDFYSFTEIVFKASQSIIRNSGLYGEIICKILENPPNSAQLGAPLPFPKLHPGPCSSVGVRRETVRHTHTDTQTRMTNIHFVSSTTHAKCNKKSVFKDAI